MHNRRFSAGVLLEATFWIGLLPKGSTPSWNSRSLEQETSVAAAGEHAEH